MKTAEILEGWKDKVKAASGEADLEEAIKLAFETLRWKGKKIKVHFEHPPIPVRDHDYSAVFDGYEPGDHSGSGRTEEDAIRELIYWEEGLY